MTISYGWIIKTMNNQREGYLMFKIIHFVLSCGYNYVKFELGTVGPIDLVPIDLVTELLHERLFVCHNNVIIYIIQLASLLCPGLLQREWAPQRRIY